MVVTVSRPPVNDRRTASIPHIAFPSTEPPSAQHPPTIYQRPPHLPFRRISLPTSSSIINNRQSVASLTSFESLPEDGQPHPAPAPSRPPAGVQPTVPALMQKAARKPKARPVSIDGHKRVSKHRPRDDAKEVKRRRIVQEFYETERSYVDGLDLIYNLFLMPILESLETPHPILEREELTAVFSNFIDIWNLHRSFFASLTAALNLSSSQSDFPLMSPLLTAHFPYLSLYTPFVTSFPTVLSSLQSQRAYNPAFAAFVTKQEADEQCRRLSLRDWLLTIVQRCPRYLLLLKDLIECTEEEDPERTALTAVHTLVSKITLSLNTSLHTHAQTLALLEFQRNTPNLPFQLIAPGRTLLRRGALLQLERSTSPRPREFLLFSDCLLWLAKDKDGFIDWEWRSWTGLGGSGGSIGAESGDEDERWWYKGKVQLLDIEVVQGGDRSEGYERRLEVLSPETSFAIYASSEAERDAWVSAIRSAKEALLISLNIMHPNTTLTSSASNAHLRKTLQALPTDEGEGGLRRGIVEHFVPAVWVPDGRTNGCMRCGRTFGWRRRRHHCRLCGRCVCASCSARTFLISDPSQTEEERKPARACNVCYETVFPVLNDEDEDLDAADLAHKTIRPSDFAAASRLHDPRLSAIAAEDGSGLGNTLSSLPSWRSIIPLDPPGTPSALMSIRDRNGGSPRNTAYGLFTVQDTSNEGSGDAGAATPMISQVTGVNGNGAPAVVRQARYRNHLNIPPEYRVSQASSKIGEEDEEEADGDVLTDDDEVLPSAQHHLYAVRNGRGSRLDVTNPSAYETPNASRATINLSSSPSTPASSGHLPNHRSPSKSAITATSAGGDEHHKTSRKSKRFSVPAMALHTTPVQTRPNATGEGRGKRFSLVLGRGVGGARRLPSGDINGPAMGITSHSTNPKAGLYKSGGGADGKSTLGSGAAAGKLNELLAASRGQEPYSIDA